MVLDIEKYERNVCFVCGEKCELYAHRDCCAAYCHDLEKRRKVAVENYNKGSAMKI